MNENKLRKTDLSVVVGVVWEGGCGSTLNLCSTVSIIVFDNRHLSDTYRKTVTDDGR